MAFNVLIVHHRTDIPLRKSQLWICKINIKIFNESFDPISCQLHSKFIVFARHTGSTSTAFSSGYTCTHVHSLSLDLSCFLVDNELTTVQW